MEGKLKCGFCEKQHKQYLKDLATRPSKVERSIQIAQTVMFNSPVSLNRRVATATKTKKKEPNVRHNVVGKTGALPKREIESKYFGEHD